MSEIEHNELFDLDMQELPVSRTEGTEAFLTIVCPSINVTCALPQSA